MSDVKQQTIVLVGFEDEYDMYEKIDDAISNVVPCGEWSGSVIITVQYLPGEAGD